MVVTSLRVQFSPSERAVDDVTFSIAPGEILGLVGESGSGKTTVCRAIAGILEGSTTVEGDVCISGIAGSLVRRPLSTHGPQIGCVFQAPDATLNPCVRIGTQLTEHLRAAGMSERESTTRATEMLRRMRITDASALMRRYPHQISGGQQQRVAIAIALLQTPEALILDEPTTALDVTTQAAILALLDEVLDAAVVPVLYVSHDLRVVGEIADRVAVMHRGELVEIGPATSVLREPSHPYTRALVAALPELRATPTVAGAAGRARGESRALANSLSVELGSRRARQRVLSDVSLELNERWTVAIVGESGAGKTTLARALVGLLPANEGEIELDGETLAPSINHRSLQQIAKLQLVFQSSTASLNPRRTVGTILRRAVRQLGRGDRKHVDERVRELLAAVQLPPWALERKPPQLSGGEKQRVAIARALAAQPRVMILDEAVSALDVSVQAAILALLRRVQSLEGTAFLFISHDLAVVSALADEIIVLYGGKILEHGPMKAVLEGPHHPYTEVLFRSVPGEIALSSQALTDLDNPINRETGGCIFATRCPWRIGDICNDVAPPHRIVGPEHEVLCHYEADELLEVLARDRGSAGGPSREHVDPRIAKGMP